MGAVGGGGCGELHACEVFNFFAHDADAAFVGGVEFEDPGFDQFGAVELLCEGEDGGGFAGAGGAVEEHMWELRGWSVRGVGGGLWKYIGRLKGSLEDCDCMVLSCDILEILWPARFA